MNKQERRQAAKEDNTRKLLKSGVQFYYSNEGETLMVREPYAVADFYPSRGSWKDIAGGGVHYTASAHNDFFAWLRSKRQEFEREEKVKKAIWHKPGKSKMRRMYTRYSQQK